jgi:hypothetical protein
MGASMSHNLMGLQGLLKGTISIGKSHAKCKSTKIITRNVLLPKTKHFRLIYQTNFKALQLLNLDEFEDFSTIAPTHKANF